MNYFRIMVCAFAGLTATTVFLTGAAQSVAAQRQEAAASIAMTSGEVRKVDKDAQKLTIKHGPIENLGMPAMTMVFRVKNPVMLNQVKAADKIRFTAESVGGALTVTRIETTK